MVKYYLFYYQILVVAVNYFIYIANTGHVLITEGET